MSLYLYILCAKALIANIRKKEEEKMLTGLKIARGSPAISHLLFADDSLFFCKANRQECEVILQILKDYECASGQQINFSKSSIQFGHKVPEVARLEVQQILGITTLGGMGTYLGIPASLEGSKTQIFGFLNERVNNKVNHWTLRFITKGGKEVLIKSVASPIPTHVMSCFRLPKTVTEKLTSTIAHFWWGGSGNSKGMHWFSWDKLCNDKAEGGISFRDIQNFNAALLAKQLWRLIDKPDSLLARVFKGRYYRNSDPLDPIRSYSPSYGWRSITSARSLVNKRLIKRVGTGSSISVWNDPWIPAPCPRSATPKFSNQFLNPLLKDDVSTILSLAISRNPKSDSYGWHFTDHGRYTVKSGYRTEKSYPDMGEQNINMGPNTKPLLAQSWKLQCSPKLQHFVWQIISGCLPVYKNLHSHGIKCDTQC